MIDSMQLTLSVYANPFVYADPLEEQHRFERLFNFIKENQEYDPSLLTKTKDGKTVGNAYAYNAYKDKGVQLQIDEYSGQVLVTVYPHRLIDPSDRVTLYTPQDHDLFISGINHIMDEIDSPHIDSSHWQVKRVDYAVNILTPYPRLYLDLLNRSHSKHYQSHEIYDGNSCYLKGKGCTYNIYDKQNQLMKKLSNPYSRQDVTNKDIEDAQDILRLEIQCRKQKAEAIRKSYKWKDRNIENYLQPSVAIGVLHTCAKHFYNGEYHTAEKGKGNSVFNLIDSAKGLQQTTKDNMILIANMLSSDRNVTLDEVKDSLTPNTISASKFSTIIRRFNALDINPVPIPTLQARQYHLTSLESLPTLLNEYIEVACLPT